MRRTALAVLLAVITGCGASGAPGAAPRHSAIPTSPSTPRTGVPATSATTSATTPTGHGPCGRRPHATYRHVVWIWMENRTYSSVLGASGGAPRLRSYGRACGVATAYRAITHPSLPNYLAAVSGSTGGVTSDCSPASCPQHRASLFDQVAATGRTWRGYAESMGRPCDQASYDGYAARHNPAVYFTQIRARCGRWDVPMGGSSGPFAHALAAGDLPAFAFVTPNLCHDGHDCATSTADRWLGEWLGRIARSAAYRAGDVAVFVTWDEGVGADNRVATVVMAPSVKPGTRYGGRLTHYSLLWTTEQLLGLRPLGHAGTAPSMRAPFRL